MARLVPFEYNSIMFGSPARLAIVVLLVCSSGCSLSELIGTQIQGKLLRNQSPFQASWCTSGEVDGFHGVEFQNETGERARLVVDVDGSSRVVYFPPRASVGIILANCSDVVLERTGTRINGYRKWTGRASLHCRHESVELEGDLAFSCSAP
jgi:hypothetical protein